MPEDLAALTNLTSLQIKCCPTFHDGLLQQLGDLKKLRNLQLGATGIDGAAFASLAWPSLQSLAVGKRMNSDNFASLSKACPALKQLRLDHCEQVRLLSRCCWPLPLRTTVL